MNLCKGLTKRVKSVIVSSIFAVIMAVSAVGGIFIHNNYIEKNNPAVPGGNNINNYEGANGGTNYAVETDGALNYVLETDTDNLAYSLGVTEYYTVVGAVNKNATSITIPQSFNDKYVLKIGYKAFDGMKNLTSVFVHEKMLKIDDCAFYGCTNLLSVTLFDELKSIGDYAFKNCYSLMELEIPRNVTYLGQGMLYGCNNLGHIVVDENNEFFSSIGSNGDETNSIMNKDGSVLLFVTINSDISEGVTEFGVRSFNGIASKSLTFSNLNNIKKIGDYCFEDCFELNSISFPASLEEVGVGIFSNCNNLETIIINRNNENLRSRDLDGNETNCIMNYYADTLLVGCKDTIVANSVKKIGDYAFYNCGELTQISLPENVSEIGEYAYYGCSSLNTLVIPETITLLGNGAFQYCSKLTSATIPNSITNIPDYAFLGCSELSEVNFSEQLTTIGTYSFYKCSKLDYITIPENVSKIGYYAFGSCENLENVKINSLTIYLSLNEFMFENATFYKIKKNIDEGTNSYLNSYFEKYIISEYNSYKLNYKINVPTDVIVQRNGIEITSSTPIHKGDLLNISYTETAGYHKTSFAVNGNEMTINNYAYIVDGNTTITFTQSKNQAIYRFYMDDRSTLLYTKTVLHGGSITVSNPNKNSDDMSIIYTFEYWATGNGSRANLSNISVATHNSTVNLYAVFNATQVEEETCLVFEDDGNGNLIVAGFDYEVEHLVIPETYANKKVVGIKEDAFNGSHTLITVIIPDTVTYIGNQAFYDCALQNVHIGSGVTDIGMGAFIHCTQLWHVNIPDSVQTIGSEAFAYCYELASVDINLESSNLEMIDNLAFIDCNALTSFTIPDNVVYVGYDILTNCYQLNSLTIGRSIEFFDNNFDGLDNLRFLTLRTNFFGDWWGDWLNRNLVCIRVLNECDDGILGNYGFQINDGNYNVYTQKFYDNYEYLSFTYGDYGVGEGYYVNGIDFGQLCDVYIPSYYQGEHVVGILDGIASNRTELLSLYISSDIEYIGQNAFSYCYELTTVTFDEYNNYLNFIGTTAFQECKLRSIRIPDSVTELGNYIFTSCESLVSATIGNSLESLSEGTFSNCPNLLSIDMGNNISNIESYAFQDCRILSSISLSQNLLSLGDYAFLNCSEYLVSVTMPNNITTIGSYCFSDCINLISIKLPENLIEINEGVFNNCNSLIEIDLPDSLTTIDVYAFSSCGLIEIDFPDSLTTISDYAFYNCHSLIEIDFPNSLTTISDHAFECCDNLNSINISANVNYIGSNVFENCCNLNTIKVDKNNTYYTSQDTLGNELNCIIERSTFKLIYGSNNTTFPNDNSVRIIDNYAFYNLDLSSLTSLPESITTIGVNAFYNCKFSNLTLPSGLVSIGNYAFSNCSNLKSIIIPRATTSIGNYAFRNCENLESIIVESGNTKYTSRDNSGNEVNAIIDINAMKLIFGCKNTVIPTDSSVYTIGSYAFYYVKGLSEIVIPSQITTIENNAFSGSSLVSVTFAGRVANFGSHIFSNCRSLESVTFENGALMIGDRMFYNCDKLTSIVIPAGVTTIGNYAFYNCYSLSSVTFLSSVSSIGNYAFAYCSSLVTIDLPDSLQGIGSDAFRGCSSLAEIVLGSDLVGIGNYSFTSCTKLETVTIKSSQIYNAANGTGYSKAGYLLNYATTVKVLKSIVDTATNSNTYLNNTAYFNKVTDGDYYVYIKR